MKRITLSAIAWLAIAASAAAQDMRDIAIDPAPAAPAQVSLQREAVIGEWLTQFANESGGPIVGAGQLRITRDSGLDGLDGVSPAPGWDGVQTGEVEPGPNGSLIWSGRWASIWPEGATMGSFRLIFSDANTFTGVWSSDDGEVVDAAWNGMRLR